jgi:hypothetical protein
LRGRANPNRPPSFLNITNKINKGKREKIIKGKRE